MIRTLHETIAQLRADLVLERETLRRRISEIDIELNRLERAEPIANSNPADREAPQSRKPTHRIKRNTIMSNVMEILESHPGGMIALDILHELNRTREPPLLRTSLSPQLSRLKQGGFVSLDGSNWKVANPDWRQSYENEAADADVGGHSSTASDTDPEAQGREAGPGGGI